MRTRRKKLLWGLSGAFLLTLAVAPLIGSQSIDLSRAFDSSVPAAENADAAILFDLRIPRVLFAAVVGAALAASGVVLQALLRNYLATPFTLGITGGASLGAVLALQFGLAASWGLLSPVAFAAALGAFGAALLVYLLARSSHGLDIVTLLLAGVTANFLFAAIVLFLQLLSDPHQSFRIARWMMGSLDSPSLGAIAGTSALVVAGLLPMLWHARDLNLLSVGDDEAASLGVDLGRTRLVLFIATSLATGAVVSVSGPIGFVGLIVPHILRLLFGADNALILPASILGGAAFLVACDTAARTLVPGMEIPVGVVTALLGCPFFLWLLRRHRREIVL